MKSQEKECSAAHAFRLTPLREGQGPGRRRRGGGGRCVRVPGVRAGGRSAGAGNGGLSRGAAAAVAVATKSGSEPMLPERLAGAVPRPFHEAHLRKERSRSGPGCPVRAVASVLSRRTEQEVSHGPWMLDTSRRLHPFLPLEHGARIAHSCSRSPSSWVGLRRDRRPERRLPEDGRTATAPIRSSGAAGTEAPGLVDILRFDIKPVRATGTPPPNPLQGTPNSRSVAQWENDSELRSLAAPVRDDVFFAPHPSADAMIRDSVIDWKELSDLYERADPSTTPASRRSSRSCVRRSIAFCRSSSAC